MSTLFFIGYFCQMSNKVDYIVVGLGLAGISFCETLLENNKSFIVFENSSQTSSLVAGGMYNPIILKRFSPAWNGHEQLQYAIPKYQHIENKLNIKIDVKVKTKKAFNTIQDQNNWYLALDKPNTGLYMVPEIEKGEIKGIICKNGFATLTGTGRIQMRAFIQAYKNYLKIENKLVEDDFIYKKLEINESLKYQDLIAEKIVFCEGYGLKKNPFFNHLPLNGTKGETIDIFAPKLTIDFVLKSSIFIMPLGNHTYKIGATFNWKDKTTEPTQEGKNELISKLNKVINVPYQIIAHSAGIRPTVIDRRPLVGTHPLHKQLAVLNGLGTRGVMISPTIANSLFNYIEKGTPLEKEISIERFT